MERLKLTIMTSLILLLAVHVPVFAAWYEHGTLICGEDGWQRFPSIIPDGSHGAFIEWQDLRSGDWDIYVQWVNQHGKRQWLASGIPICTATHNQHRGVMAPDGEGGIYITWFDHRNGSNYDIYAQRVDSLGNTLWTTDGIPIATTSGHEARPVIIPDGAGNAIIAWYDSSSTGSDVCVQKIDPNGAKLWSPDNIEISSVPGYQYYPKIIGDGAGGAIVTWYELTETSYEISAQKIESDGTIAWTSHPSYPRGVPICTASGDQIRCSIAPDGANGAIISWQDLRGGGCDIYAQRVDPDGTVLWAVDGVPVCLAPYHQEWPIIVTDHVGGAVICWMDNRDLMYEADIYAQRINEDGNALWATNGVALCTLEYKDSSPRMTSDGSGGGIVTWRHFNCSGASDILAQHVDNSGTVQWGEDGTYVCRAINTQALGGITTDDDGGAIVTWYDFRTLDYDLYAFRMNPDYIPPEPPGAPRIVAVQDVPNDQGGWLSIQWDRSDLDNPQQEEIYYYTVWRRLDRAESEQLRSLVCDSLPSGFAAAGGIPIIVNAPIPSGFKGRAMRISYNTGYAWEWIEDVPARFFDTYALTVRSLYDSTADDPGWQYFMVSAQTWYFGEFYDSPIDSGFSVDNIAPGEPQDLVAEQIPQPPGLRISWKPNEEEDFHHYCVYREVSQDFMSRTENLLIETTESYFEDSEWFEGCGFSYKVSACDIHDNESGYTHVRPSDIITALLMSFSATYDGTGIALRWELFYTTKPLDFHILKSEGAGGSFIELSAPVIARDYLEFAFRDTDCERGKSYRYRVDVSDEKGRRILFETDEILLPALVVTLYQNHPNPFNPSTTIRYYLPETSTATLDIYDVTGSHIIRLVDGTKEWGDHAATWNGLDSAGNLVTSGIYLYVLKAGTVTQARKMILLR